MDEQQDATKQETRPSPEIPPPAPPPINPPPPPPPPNPSPKEENGPKKISTSDKIMAIATIVIAAGTVVSAAAIGLQWREMHEGGIDTHALATATQEMKTSADKSAQASRDFADSANDIDTRIGLAEKDFSKMAANSEGAIRATQEAMRLDQRAWIGLAGIDGTPTLDSPFTINTRYINTGKTPALNLVYQAGSTPVLRGGKFEPKYAKRDAAISELPSETALFPNQSITQHIKASAETKIAQTDLDLLDKKDVTIYVFGRACYKDVFEKPHWMRFCSLYNPTDKSYYSCDKYNEIDNGKNGSEETCTFPK